MFSEDEKGPRPNSLLLSPPHWEQPREWPGHSRGPRGSLLSHPGQGVAGRTSAQESGPCQDELLGTFSAVACDSVLYFSTTLKCLISRGRQKPGISSPWGKGLETLVSVIVWSHSISSLCRGRAGRPLSRAHRVCFDGQGTPCVYLFMRPLPDDTQESPLVLEFGSLGSWN